MSNELVRKNLEESLSAGSLSDLVKADEVIMLLIDTSSSMGSNLQSGRSAIDHLRDAVAEINPRSAGIPMIAFGGPYDAQVRFVDTVPDAAGGTPLHIAIPMAKEYGANRVVVISDGCPDLREQCLIEARNFGGRIDVVYIGDPNDTGSFFLDELAKLTGGTRHEGDITKTREIAGKVILMLEGEVAPPPSAPIQGPGFTTVEAPDVDEDDDVDNSDSDEAEDEFENADDDDEDDDEDDE